MTDDKDFKRVVRQRMAKTGESYTTARARLRAVEDDVPTQGLIQAFRERIYTRAGMDRLGAHLEDRYGVEVRRLAELDVGVFRVERRSAPSWVARVFPAERPLEAVEGDAEVLRFLEQHGLPAERCAHADAVSTFEGQGVLVTEHVSGINARNHNNGQLMHLLGDQLGRLHTLLPGSGALAREAGSWHHLAVQGGCRRDDVEVLLPMFAEAAHGVSADERPIYESLCDELASIDDCRDLPNALIHPDPCAANTIASDESRAVLVDWTGAGRGARLASLANLLLGNQLPLVDAAIAGYRRHVQLDDIELDRLTGALQAFPLILDCWRFVFQDFPLSQVVASVNANRARAEAIAARARVAFDADDAALGGWELEPPPNQVQIEGQTTLF